jgi:hypothetical protein
MYVRSKCCVLIHVRLSVYTCTYTYSDKIELNGHTCILRFRRIADELAQDNQVDQGIVKKVRFTHPHTSLW